ncbi:MAG: response regulator [Halothiobacillaceae bacterium]
MKWPFLVILVLLEGILLAGVHALWSKSAEDILEAKSRETLSAYAAITQTYGQVADLMHDTLFSRPGVRRLFHQGLQASDEEQAILRGRLLRLLWDDYQHMTRYNLVQLHFHTAEGDSYLRFHRPEVSGDSLLAARPSVRMVLETGKPARGFENGKLFHGYRFVFPVRIEDRLIGSVETSIDFEAIRAGLSEVMPDHEFTFWLRRANLDARIGEHTDDLLYPVQVNPDYVIEDLQARLSHETELIRSERQVVLERRVQARWSQIRASMAEDRTFSVPVRLRGLDYAAIQFMPIHDISGAQAGYLVSYADLPELSQAARNYLVMALGAGLLLALLLWFIYRQRAARRVLANERHTLKAITDNMLEGLFVQDRDGRMTYWNPALERILGFSRTQLENARVHDLIHAHDHHGEAVPMERCPIRVATLRGDVYYAEREGFRRSDGTVLPVEVTCAPMIRDGRIVGSVTVFRDMTQRIEMQRAQDEAREAAERAARMKSSFLANMSHEIRTPMNGVMGMLELALDTELSPEQREYLEIAQRSGELLLALLNDILDVSKVDAGHLDIEHVAFDVVEVIEHTGKLMAARAHQKHLELNLDIDPALPRHIMGDPLRLRQVLLNLLGNAIKFTETGEVTLSAGITGDQVRFSVRDTGIGISQEAQAHIFEPFRQADESTTRKYGGTGLGLALSQRLVSLMGGQLQLESQPGVGSTFYFDLALVPADHQPEDATRPVDTRTLAGRGLLVVDDINTNRLILERNAVAWGMRPHGFANPLQALDWLRRDSNADRVAAAVIDRMMPQMDGLDLAARIRQVDPEIRLVILSSAGDARDQQAAAEGLIDQALAKPTSQDALAHALVSLVASPATTTNETATRTDRSALAARLPDPTENESEGPATGTSLLGRRVLVVEDNQVNRLLARRLLGREGAEVAECVDGAEAVACLTQDREFDLVLMDCQMPVMDGPEATRQIRENEQSQGWARLPILALTAHAGTEQVDICLSAGMDAVLSKPYNREQLLEAIASLIGDTPAERTQAPEQHSKQGDMPVDDEVIDNTMLEGLEEALGDEIREIVDFFLNSLDNQLDDLKRALASKDMDEIRRRAHALKGSAGNLGALGLSDLARQIEQSAHDGESVDGQTVARIEPMAERTKTLLAQRYA